MTNFEREISEQPEILARLLQDDTAPKVAEEVRRRAPRIITTFARGSSDNAVTFFGYLAAQTLGLPVSSLPPSLVTVYGTALRGEDTLTIGVSQSGEGSDVIGGLQALRDAGATTVAISNNPESALMRAAEFPIAQRAGPERALAASKTFSTQMLLLSLLVAHWSEDEALLQALEAVPAAMQSVLSGKQDELQRLILRLTHAKSIYILGRGLSYSAAHETALKLKETCYVHAEAYSSAEFQHGPIAAVSPSDPVLMLALDDPTENSNHSAASKLREASADLSVISSNALLLTDANATATLPSGLHPVTQAFVLVLSGQLLALHLALAKGLNPDAPRHLKKITKTM